MKTGFLYVMLFLMIVVSFGLGYGVKKCNCDIIDDESNNKENLDVNYEELNKKLIEYLEDIYSKGDLVNNTGDTKVYEYNLNDLSNMGYDISMFVNSDTGESCNNEKTLGKIIVFDTNTTDELNHTYSTKVTCNVVEPLETEE